MVSLGKGDELIFCCLSRVDALETRDGKSIQALVSYQYDGHTIAANRVIGFAGSLVLLDIVFNEADTVLLEILTGLPAVAAPGSGVHDDAPRCRALGWREGFVADAFVGVDLERELLGLVLVLRLVAKMNAATLIRPLVDFRRADQRQDGDQGKNESDHAGSFHAGEGVLAVPRAPRFRPRVQDSTHAMDTSQ